MTDLERERATLEIEAAREYLNHVNTDPAAKVTVRKMADLSYREALDRLAKLDEKRSGGRVNVRINESAVYAMQRLVAQAGSATEVIRRAIALHDMIETERAKGKEIELKSPDGTRERLRFLY